MSNLAFQLLAAANYIDALGGVSQSYRQALAAHEAAKPAQLPPLPEPEELGMDFDNGWDGVKAYGYTEDQMRDYARADLAMSPKPVSGTSLPPPDMTMPSIAQDGPDGAHYYRASTVRRLFENKGESS